MASRTLSTLSGLTLASGQVGIDNPITLKTLNSYNEVYNFNDSSSLNVTLSFLNGTIANAATKVIYVSPGVSTITYRPPVVETFSLSVKLRGEDFPGSPFQISAVKLCSSGCWNGVCKTNGICACNIGYTGTICGTQFPLTTADISTSIGLVSFFLGILGLCTTVSGTVLIWVFRRGKFVRAGSPPCLAVIGLGLSIWSLYPIFVPLASSPFYPHSTIPCWLAPMFYHLGKSKSKLGFTISFVALLIKNIRIVMIFGAELKQISVITNNMVYAYTFLATSVIALIFGLWQGLSPTRSIIISDYTSNTLDCVDSSYSWPIALYVLEMIILFANGLVSFQARKIKNDIYAESKTIAATTYTISVLLLIFMFMLQKPLSFALVTQINTTIHFLCPFIASIFLFYWKIYNYISGREIKVLQPKESSINLEVSSNSSKKSTSIFKVLPSKCFNVKGKRLGFQGMIHTEMEDLLITVLHSSKKMIFVSHVNGAWSVGFSIANDGDVGKMFQKTVVQGQNFGSAVLNSRSGSFLISDSIEVLDQLYDAISDAIAGNDKSESLSVSKDGYGSKGASHNVKSINATSEMAGAN